MRLDLGDRVEREINELADQVYSALKRSLRTKMVYELIDRLDDNTVVELFQMHHNGLVEPFLEGLMSRDMGS